MEGREGEEQGPTSKGRDRRGNGKGEEERRGRRKGREQPAITIKIVPALLASKHQFGRPVKMLRHGP